MNLLARNWWLLALRGVLAILAGVIAILLPGITLAALVILFGAYAFVDGISLLVAGVRERGKERKWWSREIEGEWLLILGGMLSLLLGAALILMPGTGLLALAWMVGVYLFASGVVFLALAFRLRRRRKRISALRPDPARA